MNTLWKIFKVTIILIGCFFALNILALTIDGLNDTAEPADVAVVLGNKVERDNTPSKRLQARLNRGAELYHNGLTEKIIVSGGIDATGHDEAEVMKKYLIGQAVPTEVIITDNQGYNTYATAKNAAEIMQRENWDSVILVSQYFHLPRTKLAFKKFGVTKTYTAHARMWPEFRDFYSLPREVVAYYKYLMK
ncbi:MAG TPA: YdcF family protein [Patescibacteria group bacterium]|nr:YdcF family protein [Patescibacteria group bacterium]